MFLSLVNLREMRCPLCKELLAPAGARSFIVDGEGNPVHFSPDDPPPEMTLEIRCSNGHVNVVSVPNDAGAEESMTTPQDAPIGRDAVLRP